MTHSRARRSTMYEIAHHAGVSLATVSYVANGGPKPVSGELHERVLATISQLGYRPTRQGRARRTPLLVGVVVPDMTNLFFSRAIAAAGAVLQPMGHLLMAVSSNGDAEREAELLATFVRLQVDGLLVAPAHHSPTELERLADRGLPIVLLDWDGDSSVLNRVALDNHRSAYQSTRLLVESGHRGIALVSGPTSAHSAQERLRGYRDALAAAGLQRYEAVRSGPFTHEAGRAAALDLLSLPNRPEAIFSGGVLLTLGVLQALRERRVNWPDDIALVG